MHPLSKLPREWTGPRHHLDPRRDRPRADPDAQPEVPSGDNLDWLLAEPVRGDWPDSIFHPEPWSRLLSVDNLVSLPGAPTNLPFSLTQLAADTSLQHRVRAPIAPLLDLGDFAARTDTGGTLVHFLSDYQGAWHWLLYVDDAGHTAVVGTDEDIGFTNETIYGSKQPPGPTFPRDVPTDGEILLVVCADSFSEFIYRLWIESEIWYSLDTGVPLTRLFADYVAQP